MKHLLIPSLSRLLAAALALAAAAPLAPAAAEPQTGGPWASLDQQQRILERQLRQQQRRRDRIADRQNNWLRVDGRRSRK